MPSPIFCMRTAASRAPANGNLFLSLPQDYIQSYTQDSAQLRYHQRYQIAEPYFQDDWKLSHRLTLNLGLRLSLFGTYREKIASLQLGGIEV